MGSTVDMKGRWSTHKSDIRHANWTACGLTRHFGQCHRLDIEVNITRLEVTLLDSCEEENKLKRIDVFGLHTFGPSNPQAAVVFSGKRCRRA